jgi:dual specificity phosphatase 12
VHCFAGVSRSASVAAAYLMVAEGLTPREAIDRVRAAKPVAFAFGKNFLPALRAFRESR